VGFQTSNVRNTAFCALSNWLEKYDYYFIGLYQLRGSEWNVGKYYGNALFVHKDVCRFN